jgi:hypothetical protein
MRISSREKVIIGVAVVLASLAGCTTAPRPVPTGGQEVASAEAGGVVLMVPRLDHGSYPEDVLDITAAVFVAIENRSGSEIRIATEDFSLGPPGGVGRTAVPPQELAQIGPGPGRGETELARLLSGGTALAGPVMVAQRVGPPPPAPSMRVPPPAPSTRMAPMPGRIGPGFRGGAIYRPYVGSWYYGPRPFYWGDPWWYIGSPYYPYWWGPRYYARSREEAIRYALPTGRLQAGGRTSGFVYFPRGTMPEGLQVELRWRVHEAQTNRVLAELIVPLVLQSD